MVIDPDLGPIRSHDRFGESLRAMGMAVGMVPGVGFEQTPRLGSWPARMGREATRLPKKRSRRIQRWSWR